MSSIRFSGSENAMSFSTMATMSSRVGGSLLLPSVSFLYVPGRIECPGAVTGILLVAFLLGDVDLGGRGLYLLVVGLISGFED